MTIPCSVILLEDEPTRQDWYMRDVMPRFKGVLNKNFELHKKLWSLKIHDCGLSLFVVITCENKCNQSWDVKVGVVDKTGKEIVVSRALEIFERNTFRVFDLIKHLQIQTFENWPNELHLFVEIKKREDAVTKMRRTCMQELQSDYEELLRSGKNSDITIQVKNKKFNCHQCILEARSSVFFSIMNHNIIGKASDVITVENLEPTVFEEFLLFLYTGNGKHLSQENVIELYNLADKYLLEHLKDHCMKTVTCSQILSYYEELFHSGKNSDVTIQVKGKIFNCHRCILGARSEVFAAMMEHNFKEKATGIITIEDAEAAIFQDFLFYMYTGCGKHISSKNVTQLYNLADKYLIKHLKDLCMIFKQRLLIDNFFSELLQQENDFELSDNLIHFFLENAKEIVNNEMWETVYKKNYTACKELLIAFAVRK